VVVVGQARELLVVLVVAAEQQNPTSCGAS
jgi:hypothetical protein